MKGIPYERKPLYCWSSFRYFFCLLVLLHGERPEGVSKGIYNDLRESFIQYQEKKLNPKVGHEGGLEILNEYGEKEDAGELTLEESRLLGELSEVIFSFRATYIETE